MTYTFALPLVLVQASTDIAYDAYDEELNLTIIDNEFKDLFPEKAKGPKIWIMGREYNILDYSALTYRDPESVYSTHKKVGLVKKIVDSFWKVHTKKGRIQQVSPIKKNAFPNGLAIRIQKSASEEIDTNFLSRLFLNILKIVKTEQDKSNELEGQIGKFDPEKYNIDFFFYETPIELLNASNCDELINNLKNEKIYFGLVLYIPKDIKQPSNIIQQVIGYPASFISQGWVGFIPIFNNNIHPRMFTAESLMVMKSTQSIALVDNECCRSEYEILLTPFKEMYHSNIGPNVNEFTINDDAIITKANYQNSIKKPIMLDPFTFHLAMLESNRMDAMLTLLIELISRKSEELVEQHSLLSGISVAYSLHKIEKPIKAINEHVNLAYPNDEILHPRVNLLYWIIENSKEYEINREYTVHLSNLFYINEKIMIASRFLRRLLNHARRRNEFTFTISTRFVAMIFGDIDLVLSPDLAINERTSLTTWAYSLKSFYTYWNMLSRPPISNLIVQIGRERNNDDFFDEDENEKFSKEMGFKEIVDVFATMSFRKGIRNPIERANNFISYLNRNETILKSIADLMNNTSESLQKSYAEYEHRKLESSKYPSTLLWLLRNIWNKEHPIYKIGRFSVLIIGRRPYVKT